MSKAILEIEFPSQEHLEAFTSWLSNSGEQDHGNMVDFVDEDEKHLFDLHFDYTQNNKIVAEEYPSSE